MTDMGAEGGSENRAVHCWGGFLQNGGFSYLGCVYGVGVSHQSSSVQHARQMNHCNNIATEPKVF